jgi:hypothetical protein
MLIFFAERDLSLRGKFLPGFRCRRAMPKKFVGGISGPLTVIASAGAAALFK